jgi:hypothetical protein
MVEALIDPRLKNKRFNETEPMQRMLLWIIMTCSEPHIVTIQPRSPPSAPPTPCASPNKQEETKGEGKQEEGKYSESAAGHEEGEDWGEEEVRLLTRKRSCTGTKSGNGELLIELKTLITSRDPHAALYACRALANFLVVETDFHNGATVDTVLSMFKV